MGSSAVGGDSTAPDLLRLDQALRNRKLVNADLTATITTGKVTTEDEETHAEPRLHRKSS